MEDLLNDVSEIQFAAEQAAEKVSALNNVDERLGRIMVFIANLAGDIESYLHEYEDNSDAELVIGFLGDEGIDPWTLFGDKPE